jgi:hypothetical protein
MTQTVRRCLCLGFQKTFSPHNKGPVRPELISLVQTVVHLSARLGAIPDFGDFDTVGWVRVGWLFSVNPAAPDIVAALARLAQTSHNAARRCRQMRALCFGSVRSPMLFAK